jgi:hypothetical protein
MVTQLVTDKKFYKVCIIEYVITEFKTLTQDERETGQTSE